MILIKNYNYLCKLALDFRSLTIRLTAATTEPRENA